MAKPRPRTETKRERTRVALVEAAHALMVKKGVEATSLLEITEAADVAAGTFYNYFTDKDDIATQVLDCVIENLTRRNDSAMRNLGPMDALETIALSSRCGVRELLTNPIWYWWLQRPELLVERMRAGFAHIGMRDFAEAISAGEITPPGKDAAAAWSLTIWLFVAGVRDILDGVRPRSSEAAISQAVLQNLGVEPARAASLCTGRLPTYPKIPIDFSFVPEKPRRKAA